MSKARASRASKAPKSRERKNVSAYIQEELSDMTSWREAEEENKGRNIIERVKIKSSVRLKGDKQKKLAQIIKDNKVIFIKGAAGTGKTFTVIKTTLDLLIEQPDVYRQVLITKPIIEAGGESLGFLPGGIDSKIDPYMHSFESTFKKIISAGDYRAMIDNNIIKTVPLPFMRGNTFQNCIAILDEAQNTTKLGLKLFLTRAGEDSKLIVLGDIDQPDIEFKKGEKSGLEHAYERLQNTKDIGFFEFGVEDIVRSQILIDIVRKY